MLAASSSRPSRRLAEMGTMAVEVVDLAVRLHHRQQLGLLHRVNLVDDQHRGDLHPLDPVNELPLAPPTLGMGSTSSSTASTSATLFLTTSTM